MQNYYYIVSQNKVVTKKGFKIILQSAPHNCPTLCDGPVYFKTQKAASKFITRHKLQNAQIYSLEVQKEEDE